VGNFNEHTWGLSISAITDYVTTIKPASNPPSTPLLDTGATAHRCRTPDPVGAVLAVDDPIRDPRTFSLLVGGHGYHHIRESIDAQLTFVFRSPRGQSLDRTSSRLDHQEIRPHRARPPLRAN
jgi:hypothetical protein